jgi:hypothetical protein
MLKIQLILKGVITIDDWDDIREIRDYCDAMIEHSDTPNYTGRSAIIDEIIEKIEELR